MLNLKNFVARRRPSQNPDQMGTSSPVLQMPDDEEEDEAGLLDGLDEDLLGAVGQEMADHPDGPAPDLTDVDREHMDTARAGRDHVPTPDALEHEPCRQTLGGRMSPATRPLNPARTMSRPVQPAGSALPKIWEIEAPDATDAPTRPEPAAPAPPSHGTQEPELSPVFRTDTPARAEPAAQPNRPKTRLLGFHGGDAQEDLFKGRPAARPGAAPRFPIGWIVVMDGPGRGASFTLVAGLSTIGRDPDQTVSLDFGDTAISREGHVSIAYDEEDNRAYIGHGGKANIVRLNEKPLLTTEELQDGDTIRISKTCLRYVAFCTDDFSWRNKDEADDADG